METVKDSSLSEAFGAPEANDLLATVIAFANGDVAPSWEQRASAVRGLPGVYHFHGLVTEAARELDRRLRREMSESGSVAHARPSKLLVQLVRQWLSPW